MVALLAMTSMGKNAVLAISQADKFSVKLDRSIARAQKIKRGGTQQQSEMEVR
jgi:hypothetical protein